MLSLKAKRPAGARLGTVNEALALIQALGGAGGPGVVEALNELRTALEANEEAARTVEGLIAEAGAKIARLEALEADLVQREAKVEKAMKVIRQVRQELAEQEAARV
jgi:hypothetical protein